MWAIVLGTLEVPEGYEDPEELGSYLGLPRDVRCTYDTQRGDL